MIIDTSFLSEFYHAEKINSYMELMTYMRQFTKEHYNKCNILIQKHHVIPSFECTDLDQEEEIWLPVSIHFRAHILRAREFKFMPGWENYSIANYTEAYCILRKFRDLKSIFYKEYQEAKECYQIFYRPETYEKAYGKRRANIIKRKISYAMSNLDQDVLNKRANSIAKYAANRPESHNKAISNAKKKPILDSNNKYYASVKEASEATGISESSIRKCCQGKKAVVKGISFDYMI